MISNWESTKERSKYHFNNFKIDPKYDTIIHLGKIATDWQDSIEQSIKLSKPVSWRTRTQEGKSRPEEEYLSEEYDLEKIGMPKDYKVTNLTYNVHPVFKKISDEFGLENSMVRVHVQYPGQVWNLHLDKLEKWAPNNPDSVIRVFIALTDYEQGHFWSYGNYIHAGWKRGEIHTFDWQNVPHCTANAGHNPRATLQITGLKTDITEKFLQTLKRYQELRI